MRNDTADRISKMPRGLLSIISRLSAAGLAVGIGLVALASSPASAFGPATQIVLSSSSVSLLLLSHPTTLTATIEDSSGNTVTSSNASVTFTQTSGSGAVTGLGTFTAVNGI